MKKTVKKKKLVVVKTAVRQLTRDRAKDVVGGGLRRTTNTGNGCSESYTACGNAI